MIGGGDAMAQLMGWNDRMVSVTRLELCAAQLLAHEEAAAVTLLAPRPFPRIDVNIGMPDQRNSLLGRLGPDESVALGGAVLIGGDGVDEYRHRARMREAWLMTA